MAVIRISDSACDISQRKANELNTKILPLKTLIDGVEYRDGVTLTPHAFYDKLGTCGELPTTSQLSPADFEDAFRLAVEKRHCGGLFSPTSGNYRQQRGNTMTIIHFGGAVCPLRKL